MDFLVAIREFIKKVWQAINNPIVWIAIIVVAISAYLFGWNAADQRAEVTRLKQEVADRDVTIADRERRLKLFGELQAKFSRIGETVQTIIIEATKEDENAPAVSAVHDPACDLDDAGVGRVQHVLDRARQAFTRARSAAGPR